MRRLAGLTSVCLLTLGVLTACGGGDDFCGTLEDLNDSSSTDADSLRDSLDELADNAPDELQGDFDVLTDNFDAIESGDPSAIDPDTADQLQDALTSIQEYSVDECDLDLENL